LKKKFAIVLALVALLQLSGCGINSINDVEQPAQVLPSSTFNVYILDLFTAIDSTHIIGQQWKAESLLIAPQLPKGWTVNSVKFCIDTAFFRHYYTAADSSDTGSYKPVVDSLDNAGKMTTATRSSGFDAGLVANWDTLHTGRLFYAYLGRQGFNIPARTRVDTCIASDSGSSSMVDSTGIKYVGCFIKISLTAPAAIGTYNLAYFAGFDPGNLTPPAMGAQKSYNAIKDSNIIIVTHTPAVEKRELALAPQKLTLNVSPNPVRGSAVLSYYLPKELDGQPVQLSVYNVNGTKVMMKNSIGTTGWNRTVTLSGNALPSGTYLAKIQAGRQGISRTLVIMK
jgi:hypothetical protein